MLEPRSYAAVLQSHGLALVLSWHAISVCALIFILAICSSYLQVPNGKVYLFSEDFFGVQ